MALLAFLLQAIALLAPLGDDDLLPRILFIASYLLLFVFVAANIRRPGIVILGVGIALNFLPIITNGGLMPITPETIARTGDVPDVDVGEWIPGSKDVLMERDDVRLYFLSDRLVWGATPVRAFSIGDVVIVVGLHRTARRAAPATAGRVRALDDRSRLTFIDGHSDESETGT